MTEEKTIRVDDILYGEKEIRRLRDSDKFQKDRADAFERELWSLRSEVRKNEAAREMLQSLASTLMDVLGPSLEQSFEYKRD